MRAKNARILEPGKYLKSESKKKNLGRAGGNSLGAGTSINHRTRARENIAVYKYFFYQAAAKGDETNRAEKTGWAGVDKNKK